MLIDESEAVDRLRGGAVVALPTDTVYGLCATPGVAGATGRLFELKERPAEVALPVLVADSGDADGLAELTPLALRLIEQHWPGPLTVVVTRRGASLEWDLGGAGPTVGLRCPNEDVLRRVAREVGPLAVTSANLHGRPPCFTAQECEDAFAGAVPVVDGGRRAAIPSTVVDCTGDEPVVLRQGVIRPT